MFYNPDELQTVGENPQRNGSVIIFWVAFATRNTVDLATFLLNTLVLVAGLTDKEHRFLTSFYIIMYAFMITVLFQCSSSMFFSFFAEAMEQKDEMVFGWSTLIDLFSTYFTVVLIFMLGFNRFINFTLPELNRIFFKRNILIGTLLVSSVVMMGFSYLIYNLSGATRSVDSIDGVQIDSVADMDLINEVNYVFYAIPILSSLFYVRVLWYLRSQRKNAISGKTKQLLCEAEMCTIALGRSILIIYVSALICNILMCYELKHFKLNTIVLGLKDVIAAAPQIGLPLSSIVTNNEMRTRCKTLVWSTLHLPEKSTRIGSASSIKLRIIPQPQ